MIRQNLYMAAVACKHVITSDVITLHADPTKPGNALGQLADRLLCAFLGEKAPPPSSLHEKIVAYGVACVAAADLQAQPEHDHAAEIALAEIVAELAVIGSPRIEASAEVAALMRFYDAGTLEALVLAQNKHVEGLQARLPKDTQPAVSNPRQG